MEKVESMRLVFSHKEIIKALGLIERNYSFNGWGVNKRDLYLDFVKKP